MGAGNNLITLRCPIDARNQLFMLHRSSTCSHDDQHKLIRFFLTFINIYHETSELNKIGSAEEDSDVFNLSHSGYQ